MFNLSTQEVVLSIEKSPLKIVHGIIYQEYRDFFGKEFQLPELQNKNFVKLEFVKKKYLKWEINFVVAMDKKVLLE